MPNAQIINRFLEDSCVLVTAAYLVARGQLLPRLFQRSSQRDLWVLAVLFGLFGGSEILFPGDRYPYVPYTLAATFAGYAGAWALGLRTALVMTVLALIGFLWGVHVSQPILSILAIAAAGMIGGGASGLWRRPAIQMTLRRHCILLLGAFGVGACAELFRALIHMIVAPSAPGFAVTAVAYRAVANGFGCVLLTLVFDDANERRVTQQRQVLAEQEAAALRLSQMGELQARLHPHFLFNALAGIAGLCITDPTKAERAVTALAGLLRRFLRTPIESSIPLREELETVRSYLAIEQLRLGDRLSVLEDMPLGVGALPVPRFCLQVAVENAIQHGIAPTGRPGCIRIVARLHPRHVLLAICDDGGGITPGVHPPDNDNGQPMAPHGLSLLEARLRLAYGSAARLRLCSTPGVGTLCALRLPIIAGRYGV